MYRRRKDERIVTASQTQRDHLAEVMQGIHRRGWCEGTGGNFSMVLQHQPLQLLMAPSGVDKGQVPADQLIVVDGQGKAVGEGKPVPKQRCISALWKQPKRELCCTPIPFPERCCQAMSKTKAASAWRAGRC